MSGRTHLKEDEAEQQGVKRRRKFIRCAKQMQMKIELSCDCAAAGLGPDASRLKSETSALCSEKKHLPLTDNSLSLPRSTTSLILYNPQQHHPPVRSLLLNSVYTSSQAWCHLSVSLLSTVPTALIDYIMVLFRKPSMQQLRIMGVDDFAFAPHALWDREQQQSTLHKFPDDWTFVINILPGHGNELRQFRPLREDDLALLFEKGNPFQLPVLRAQTALDGDPRVSYFCLYHGQYFAQFRNLATHLNASTHGHVVHLKEKNVLKICCCVGAAITLLAVVVGLYVSQLLLQDQIEGQRVQKDNHCYQVIPAAINICSLAKHCADAQTPWPEGHMVCLSLVALAFVFESGTLIVEWVRSKA
ncbi:hypothetical protein CF327_g5197 [Tilletia walkeri]|nr:hypothetical protein CF327_g5197 [Tilletia walkeri]